MKQVIALLFISILSVSYAQKCEKLNPSCQECSDENKENTCTNCYTGYKLENGKCIDTIQNCFIYSDSGEQCISCMLKFNESEDKKTCYPHILSCDVQKNDKCEKCIMQFVLKENKCELSASIYVFSALLAFVLYITIV